MAYQQFNNFTMMKTVQPTNQEMDLVMNEIDNDFLKNILFPKEGTSSSYINHIEDLQSEYQEMMDTEPKPEWALLDRESFYFGDHDKEDDIYLTLLDEQEMSKDMDAFEYDDACHNYFADGGEGNVTLSILITNLGKSGGYATGECEYGKVFIPNVALNFFRNNSKGELREYCNLQFKGFSYAREKHKNQKNISMPWRCLRVIKRNGW